MADTKAGEPTGFLKLFNFVADELKGNDQLVAFQLLRHWSATGSIFPGVARLAEKTGLSRSTVLRSIKSLEASGAVMVTRTKGVSNRYELSGKVKTEPVSQGDQCHTDTSSTQTPVPVSQGDGYQCHSDTLRNPSKKSKKKPISWRVVPEAWEPKESHQVMARNHGVNLIEQRALFKDHEFEKPKTDPDRAFNNWIRRAGGSFKPSSNKSGPIRRNYYTPQSGMAAGVELDDVDVVGF